MPLTLRFSYPISSLPVPIPLLPAALPPPPGAVVIELLPWEYPNLTFYVALSWLPVLHAAMVVEGANAYGAMTADVSALVGHVRDMRMKQLAFF